MRMKPRFSLTAACLLVCSSTIALAQDTGSWIDPPAAGAAPPPASEPPANESPAAAPAPAPQPAPRAQSRPQLEIRPEAPAARAPSPRPPAVAAEPSPPRQPAEPSRRSAETPRQPQPAPPPEVAERQAPSERPAPAPNRSDQRSAAAEALAIDYLNTWSAPNSLTLDSTLSFYGSVVNFHGRTIGARELLEEKRRFVRRWPERDYQPRLDSVDASCPAESRSCIVRSTFDFAAANPAQGRRSEGTGTLELIVNFEGGRPIIVAERSVVRARDRSAQRSAVREAGDE